METYPLTHCAPSELSSVCDVLFHNSLEAGVK